MKSGITCGANINWTQMNVFIPQYSNYLWNFHFIFIFIFINGSSKPNTLDLLQVCTTPAEFHQDLLGEEDDCER